MVAYEESLTEAIAKQEAHRREQLEQSARIMRSYAEDLIAHIDRGDYTYLGTGRNEPLQREYIVDLLRLIYLEGMSRSDIIQAAAREAGRNRT